MKELKWRSVGRSGMFNAPMLNRFEAQIGKDEEGRMWSVRVEFRTQEKKFMVWFDHDAEYLVDISDRTKYEEDDGYGPIQESTPFLRTEVVYSKNYWRAHEQVYSTQFVDYEKIGKTIEDFVNRKRLNQEEIA